VHDLDRQKYIPLEEASKRVPYSSAYLRLRILQEKLKAIKKGKSWVTTQEWLDEYMRHVRAWEEFQLENGIANGRKKGGRTALSRKGPQAIVASSPERHLEGNFKLQEHDAEHIGVVSEQLGSPASVIDARDNRVQSFDETFLGISTADRSVESWPLAKEISSTGKESAAAEGRIVSDLVPVVEESPRRMRTFSRRVAEEFSSREVNLWLRRRMSAGGLPPKRIVRIPSFTFPVRLSVAVVLLAVTLARGGFLDMRNFSGQMSESGGKVLSLSASFGEKILSRSSRLASSILSFRPADLLPAPSFFYPSSSFQYASLLTPFGQRVGNAVSQTVSSIQNAWGDMVAYFLPEQRIVMSQESVNPDRSVGENFHLPADQTGSSSSSLSADISIYTSSRAPLPAPARSDLASSVGVIATHDPQLLSRVSSLESGREEQLTRILNLASTLLSVAERANQAQSTAKSSITIVNQSQKIDTLTEASALKGFTVSSGNLAVSSGTFSVSGNATLSSDATVGGTLTVSGSGTSTFAGPVTIAGALTANNGSLTISSTSTVTTQFTVSKVPSAVHTFVTWAPDTADSNVTEASLLLNPASAASDTNLFGLAVNSLPKFIVDAEGDVFAKSVTLSGGATLASTTISGTLTIESNSFLGDAPNNDSTVIKGITSIFATSTAPALSIWNSTPQGSLLSLSTGASSPTSIFRVSAGGQTTIGTTTPSGLSILTLTSTTTDSIPLTIKGVSSQSANLLSVLSSTDTSYFSISNTGLATLTYASTTQLSSSGSSYFATSNGNVGIGTTSPASLLSVQGNSYVSGTSFFGGAITGTSTASFGTTTVTNLITTNVSTSTFAGGIQSPYLNLTGTAASSTVSGGFQTAGFSSSNGLTLTGGSILASSVNALLGSTTVSHLTVSNTGSSTFAGPITHSTGDLIVARGGSGNLLLNPYGGNVGIGTSTPGSLLSLGGIANFTTSTSTFYSTIGGINLSGGCFAVNGTCVGGSQWVTNGNNISYTLGNVGVGTTSPNWTFQIAGSRPSFALSDANAGTDLKHWLFSSMGGNLYVGKATDAYATSSPAALTILNSGNIGIGTTSPTRKLQVSGDAVSVNRSSTDAAFYLLSLAGVDEWGVNLDANSNLAFYENNATARLTLANGGNVGIGTTSPSAALSIVSSSNNFPDSFGNNLKLNGTAPALWWKESDASRGYFIGLDGGILSFARESGNSVEQYVLGLNSNNEILVAMPGTQNTVAACHATNGVTTSYGSNALVDCSGAPSDIAEWYDTSSDVDLGDVVAPSSTTGNQFNYSSGIGDVFNEEGRKTEGVPLPGATTTISVLSKSTSPYQSTIIGIVSTAPYQTFGEDVKNTAAHPHRIALVGRVPVKISTESGSIQAGDRIVSSSIAGTGMKAIKDGITIGIALQDFDPSNGSYGIGQSASTTQVNGSEIKTGKILVFVNLGYSKLDSSVSSLSSSSSNSSTNAWSVDQQSGKVNVNFFGDINLQGNSIRDVGSISGMFGKWKIDADGTLTAVKVVTNEVLAESLSVKSSFELGSAEKPAGMTIYDRTTGESYCVGIDIGEWFRQKGKCTSPTLLPQSLSSDAGSSTPPEAAEPTSSASSSESASATQPVETLSGNTASTTTATTTEP